MQLVSSLDNPLVKQLRSLHDVRNRREMGLFLLEGQRAIDGCLQAGWKPQHILLSEEVALPTAWVAHPLLRMSTRVAEKLSQASTPSGFIAVFPVPQPPPLALERGGLVLAEVQDPGNVGTLIRCAVAFQLTQCVMLGGADPYGHKVLQATAGTIAGMNLYRYGSDQSLSLLAGGAPRCGLVVRGGQHPAELARGPRWLVVGSEARGLQEQQLSDCDERLTLPMPGPAESLNAAMAGAIGCYALFGSAAGSADPGTRNVAG
jgi:RNA methyltransferase, TrmH family